MILKKRLGLKLQSLFPEGSNQEQQILYQMLGTSHRELMNIEKQRVAVVTSKPVAYDSPDHIMPWGTKNDNSVNLKFNIKLARWIPLKELSVLDLGCSGGGFVKSILDMGCLAVGIEGSDYSRSRGRAEWANIPDNLFTADVTEPFQVMVGSDSERDKQLQFSVITSWEMIEHIEKSKLPAVFQNISSHLKPNGIAIISVSPNEEVINGVRLHQTVEDKDWWIKECRHNGFVHHDALLQYFGEDWVRSEPNAPGSFHLILTREGEQLPHMDCLPFS